MIFQISHFFMVEIFEMPHFFYLILKGENGAFRIKSTRSILKKKRNRKFNYSIFGAYQIEMHMPSHDKIIFHMLFGEFHTNSRNSASKSKKSRIVILVSCYLVMELYNNPWSDSKCRTTNSAKYS